MKTKSLTHDQLIKDIIEKFCPRFAQGGKVILNSGSSEDRNDLEFHDLIQLGIKIDKQVKLPDLVVVLSEKKRIFLIEAVTGKNLINPKRYDEMRSLIGKSDFSPVVVTAFESRKTMKNFFDGIAWASEVWVSEEPDHLIHFNGDQLFEPYEGKK
jgi:hypothetical protein